MKSILKVSIAALAALTPMIAPAQQTQRLTATKANDYGLVYTLPSTVLDITIEARISQRQPGEFYKYAKKYLNVDNPITETSASAEVVNVVINPRGVANDDQRFMMTLKSNNAPFVVLNADNVPLAVNSERVFDKPFDAVPIAQPALPTPLETAAARQVITEEMLQSHSSAKRAELAAEQIYALRQSRTDLITGQSDQMPPDGQAMKLVMDNIDAQEQALMAMFVGTVKTWTEVKTVQFVPETDVNNVVIARVSPSKGIVGPTDLSGAPVYLSLKITRRGEMPVNDKGETLPFPKGGVAYTIPGEAEATVSFDNRVVAEKSVDIAQFGVVYGLAPSTFTDKKAPAYLLFDPTTGAAIEVGRADR